MPIWSNGPTPTTHFKIFINRRIPAMPETVESKVCEDGHEKSPRRELTQGSISQIVGQLLEKSRDGRLGRTIVPKVAKEFGVHRATVYRHFKRAKDSLKAGQLDLTTKRSQSGRKTKKNLDILQAQLVDTPPWSRGTVRDSAAQLDMPYSTFQFWVKKKVLLRNTPTQCALNSPKKIKKPVLLLL